MNNQDIIRKKIKEIQNDNNLTIIEKNTKIFNLMNSANSSKQEENNKILDCKHYERGCIIFADCCNKYYSCRICHDEEVNGHTLDSRKDVNKIRNTSFSILDKNLGILIGFIKSIVILSLLFIALTLSLWKDKIPKVILEAKTIKVISYTSHLIVDIIPKVKL